ncbi:MAG: alpha/beta hydrolase [Hyphomicrobiales bacterium]|nr:alpha/beta hydrolase [Hyphomicrobiales bacterium]
MTRARKWLRNAAIALLLVWVGAYAVDRLVLTFPCPPCHTEQTRALPRLGAKTVAGLVRIPANGMEFRSRVAGLNNRGGDGVIFLHGYPETSIMWEPVIARLAEEGFRVIAFDQRGYSPGARPGSTSSYSVDKLVSDVIAIADAAPFTRFHLVGHDWGGIVAWATAIHHPDRVATLTSLSMPHPAAYKEAFAEGADQLKRSSYVLLNWIPGVSEFILGFNNASYLRRFSWRDKPSAQREEYVRVFSEKGALRAVLNWYRALGIFADPPLGKTRQPTLFLWGYQDKSLSRIGAEKTADFVAGPYRFHKLAGGHALMVEEPDTVSDAILAHLQSWKIKNNLAGKRPPELADGSGTFDCSTSKPHCIEIGVAPNGEHIRIWNRCERRLKASIELTCSAWEPGVTLSYEFDLGPGSSMLRDATDFDYGECYHKRKVCLAN